MDNMTEMEPAAVIANLKREDKVSQETLKKVESLEVLEEAFTGIKDISQSRIIWRDSKLYNEKFLKRIFNDDIEGNARTKLLYAEHELRQRLLREHKYSEMTKKISKEFDQKMQLLKDAPKYSSMIFCPFGRVLSFQMLGDAVFSLFSEGLIIVYERSKGASFESTEILPISEDSLACACLLSPPPADGWTIDQFVIGDDSKAEMECSIIRCSLMKAATMNRGVRLERLHHGNVFGSESCSRPDQAVYCSAHQCIMTAHGSIVYLIAIMPSAFEIRVRLDLTASLRLPATPPNQIDIHRITALANRGSHVYASTHSGTIVQVQVGIGATSLRPAILQQYRALETRTNCSERFRNDDDDGTEEPNLTRIVEEKKAIKFSYAPTTVASMVLSRTESIYSACGDGTIRVQNVSAASPDDDLCFLNRVEYNDAGYLPSCLHITVCKSINILVSVDTSNRLCVWNLSTQDLIGIRSMEGLKSPYALHIDAHNDTIAVFAVNTIMFWTYDRDILPEIVQQVTDQEPSLNRSRIRK